MIETHCSLKSFNSFAIEAQAEQLFHLTSRSQFPALITHIKQAKQQNMPILILGGGSNVLFCEDFAGLIIKVELLGVDITETAHDFHLCVGAGENWHQLVSDCIDKGMDGLENLALIPGVVGAAPVQNIGAYGSEFKDFCQSVEYIDLASGEVQTLNREQCLFGYRDSIFKTTAFKNALITQVQLTLSKQWQPQSRYGALNDLDKTQPVTAKQIYQSVCEIRSTKLPDPALLGNAGSFFKNPVVKKELADALLSAHSTMPHYPQPNGDVKLAAGWLIDQANLKGHQIGGAAVHQQQALVLVNRGEAIAADIIQLAAFVRDTVKQKFDVELAHEVRFIGAQGETNLAEVLANV
ncbi:UDP-N-acetylenolpyruvoylglucosamine reductase [Psychromonas sp. psych-6C06]|uniref:UDP-N-acetylmuramate dehydrogenase n=1 Tax=Psychromonas sp. psych-6C06 TaxID=2058089 RepID=UPI000C3255B3|nr:UDP-N-acetylmuramate dehydrogenase [Psychromonas sp. psych-6C06]PKF61537.1 UDP-N-acetylenolpyruvoylglucosamine reductase [Psychromonas sp. psych-6C06]